jgi:hypothetical protein
VSLARAIMDATGQASSAPGSAARSAEVERRRAGRRAELDGVRAAHVAVYRRALAAEVAA